jgi:FtsP/CotA-like multicopper oxidase with cupredoxin domain
MRFLRIVAVVVVCLAPLLVSTAAHGTPRTAPTVCQRPPVGSEVPEPEDLRSENGTLKVDLTFRNFLEPDGEVGYCYVYKDGAEAPTLRLKPGDWLVLSLQNQLTAITPKNSAASAVAMPAMSLSMSSQKAACGSGTPMTATATNLHFHGLTVPSTCHEDDVMQTAIDPSTQAFEYRFQIPEDEQPGLYWYHPHIHGFTKTQVLGGASGALIIEGLQRLEHEAAGLPERVFVIRDQDLVNPTAAPLDAGPTPPPALVDQDGDARNTGIGNGKPAKDLSINFVPVSFPEYQPGTIHMRPQEKQLWRIVNASAITYLNLQVVYNGLAQSLQLVAMDGVALSANGLGGTGFIFENHVGLPPGGRAEFIVTGPPLGATGGLLTRSVNTGPMGENDPVRPLATVIADAKAPEPLSKMPSDIMPLPRSTQAWLGNVNPVRTRKLYFSEVPSDPNDPNSATTFMLTVDGQQPKPFDPASTLPNIVAHEGDVEDWIIENRTQELHAFHIHQIHFVLMEFFGIPINEPFLRDTVNVPFWDGKSLAYPSVRLRMDFRDPNSVGTFPYHCHLLEHEDGGMMGIIRVESRAAISFTAPPKVPGGTGLSSFQPSMSKASPHVRSFPPAALPHRPFCGVGESISAASKNSF